MSTQIAVTFLAGFSLVVDIQYFAPSPAAKPVPAEWNPWPAAAAIVLGELVYIGWMFEGEAIAAELVAVSRRWVRRRAVPGPSEASWRDIELLRLLLPGAALPLPAAEPIEIPVSQVRRLCALLARYGVDLPRRSGDRADSN
jgi:hypothetical protein